MAFSPRADLALLKINGNNFESLDLAGGSSINLGVPVFVIGHPHGHSWTLSKGYIAGKRKEKGLPIVQFSADVSPGNSGGPVMKLDGTVCGIVTYLETKKISFSNGQYIMDPSAVLKFGVSADAINYFLSKPRKHPQRLASVGEWQRCADATNIIGAVLDISHEMLLDLRTGLRSLKVEKKYDHDYSYRDIRGNYRKTGSATIVYNGSEFLQASESLTAIGHFLNQYVPGKTGDSQVDLAAQHWRDAVNHALGSIEAVHAAAGASVSRASKRAAHAKDEYEAACASMYESLQHATSASQKYSQFIVEPLVSRKRIKGLTKMYYDQRTSL
jgi:hypothetical protein